MKKNIKILQLDYFQKDAKIIQDELYDSNISFEVFPCDNKESFVKALQDCLPDIILADYPSPFPLAEILKIVKEHSVKIPFIIITNKISEVFALDISTADIDDYILKDQLFRLPEAILNSLEKYNKKAESIASFEKLKESEIKYRSFFECNTDAMVLTLPNGKVLSANPAACKMLGRTEEQIRSSSKFEILDQNDPNLPSVLLQRQQTGKAGGELTLLRKDGTKFPVEHSSVNFKDANGEDRTSIIFRDVTERKLAEEEIARSRQNYQSLINTINGIVWEADGKSLHFSFVSESVNSILGYNAQQWLDSPHFWQHHVHAEDRQKAIECYIKSAENIISCEVEYRMIAAGGEIIWLQDKVSAVKENDGRVCLRGIMTDISERKTQQSLIEESNKYLIASEQHLKSISSELEKVMNYSLDVICSMDKYGKFIRVSAASADVWGYSPDELTGQFYMAHVDPDYIDITARSLSDIMSGNATTNFENNYLHKNGNSVPLSWSARWDAEQEIMFCVARDATALKEAERLEAESQHRWKVIFDRANDAILLTNKAGRYTDVNPAAAKILGYTKEELLKLSVTDIVAKKDQQDKKSLLWEKFLKEGNQTGIIELIKKDGQIITCHYNSAANILPGLNLSILTDITERENAHKQIDQLNLTLEKRANELTASNKELEQFAYVTSHDLQEPLRMVTSFLQLLNRKYESQLDDTAQKYINFAVDGAARMKTLILDLLQYSRISTYKEKHILVDLNDVLSKTLHTFKTATDEAQATINVSHLPEVYGNKSQLMQLFQNLISNALKYKSTVKPVVIEVGYTHNEIEWEIFIKDNGIGIEPKFFEKIFVIFQRLHNRNEYEGTGIGLSICKRIVELHGGKIRVESEVNEGSKFFFSVAKNYVQDLQVRETLPPS